MEIKLPQQTPAESSDLYPLRCFGIRNLREKYFSLPRESLPQQLRDGCQWWGMDNHDLSGVSRKILHQIIDNAGADDNRVIALHLILHGDGV